MRREFKVVGKINENTKVFGTTYGQVKEVIEEGFQQEFDRLEASRSQTVPYYSMADLVTTHHIEDATLTGHIPDFIVTKSHQGQKTHTYYAIKLAQEQALSRIHTMLEEQERVESAARRAGLVVESLFGGAVQFVRGTWGATPGQATSTNILDTSGRFVPNEAYETSLSEGHLILKDKGAAKESRSVPTSFRRRSGDKDYSR